MVERDRAAFVPWIRGVDDAACLIQSQVSGRVSLKLLLTV